MIELHAAAVTLARTLTAGGTVFQIGVATPVPNGFVSLQIERAENELRMRARIGDSVLVVGEIPGRDRILRRCPAWGIASVWVGDTARPEQGLASVCLLVPDTFTALAALGVEASDLVGNIAAIAPAIVDCTDEVCITCSDEGRLGEVISASADFLPALVRTADGDEEVNVTVIGAVSPQDLVLIHAGSAIARIPDSAPTERTP
ncbi:MAG: hypothetical protein ACYCZY_07670 [Lacisediminihabitans sp.]